MFSFGNFISSLFAAIVYSILSALIISSRFRKSIVILLSRLTQSGIEYVYSNDKDASRDIVKYTRRSKEIKIFSMRAYRLILESSALHFLLEPNCPVGEVRILLADPDSDSVLKRAREYAEFDSTYTVESYRNEIQYSIENIHTRLHRLPKVKMRIHREYASFRLLIVDEYLFLSFFLKDESGDTSKVFRVSIHSPLYHAFYRYFDSIWHYKSQSPSDFVKKGNE